MQNLPDSSTNDSDSYFDSGHIFIGRGQQMDLFNIYLTRWKHLMQRAQPDDTPVTDAPSPNNKIPGLVVLLFGRGGFGKSTLLKHYRKMALAENYHALSARSWSARLEIGNSRSRANAQFLIRRRGRMLMQMSITKYCVLNWLSLWIKR